MTEPKSLIERAEERINHLNKWRREDANVGVQFSLNVKLMKEMITRIKELEGENQKLHGENNDQFLTIEEVKNACSITTNGGMIISQRILDIINKGEK